MRRKKELTPYELERKYMELGSRAKVAKFYEISRSTEKRYRLYYRNKKAMQDLEAAVRKAKGMQDYRQLELGIREKGEIKLRDIAKPLSMSEAKSIYRNRLLAGKVDDRRMVEDIIRTRRGRELILKQRISCYIQIFDKSQRIAAAFTVSRLLLEDSTWIWNFWINRQGYIKDMFEEFAEIARNRRILVNLAFVNMSEVKVLGLNFVWSFA